MKNNKNRAYLLVHPFSNRSWGSCVLESENYSRFTREKDYLTKITKFISETAENLIITQVDWCLQEFSEKLRRLKPKSLITIIVTPGDAYDGDFPRPKNGWEELEQCIKEEKLDELVIAGAQLVINSSYWGLFKSYFSCVGNTYKEMKKRLPINVRLDLNLCLQYSDHCSGSVISP